MASFRTLPRKPWTVALVLAITWMLFPGSAFGQQPRDSSKSFGSARNREERRSLLQAWKAQRKASPGTKTGQSITGGAPPPYVGRASMVINTAGTIVYTKNFLGANATCDPNIESDNLWSANTAYAVGAVVRPIGGFGQVNGHKGFNFQATNAGTSGATEPTWPTTGVGATVNDNGIVWAAIGFDPAQFVGCIPMQIISRASGGAETVIAEEGDTLLDGSQLAGWAEFIAMNSSGLTAFRAGQAGLLFTDGDDEGESGIFTAGPGAGALTRIAVTGSTIGGRPVCGVSAMVGMNDAGQVVFDTYPLSTNPNQCTEDNHGIVRFTPGPGNELLVEQGDTVGTPSATVIGFGADDATGGGPCGTCAYESIDGFINSSGNVSVVLNLSDGSQGVFNFSGPGVATQVARTGGGLTALGARTSLNNGNQVVYRGTSGGVDTLFRFTPPATTTTIVSVGAVVNGNTISSLGPYTDINNGGNVVFGGKINGDTLDAYYFWNGSTVTQVATGPVDTLSSEMITINDANQVAYVTGMTSGPDEIDGASEDYEDGGIFLWTLVGGSSNLISVGDTINGEVVTTIYAQHTSFARRQFSQAGCLATVYMVFNDDPGIDCSEGGTLFCGGTPYVRGGQLFASCAVGGCPTITVLPTTLPNGTPGVPYSQTITATGGVAPYTFAVTAGTLPPGLTLTPAGLLSGTPTTNGSFPFTITATDSGGICTGVRAYTINVAAVTIVITPPARNIFVGTTATLTVTISVAQATDTIVTLLSSNPAIASVPPSVTILAGQLSATFIVTGVALGGPVTITASLPPSFQAPPATASVTVVPVPVAEIPTLGGWAMGILVLLLAAAALLVMRR